MIVLASALALIPRDVRAMRSNDSARPEDEPLGHALEESVALGAVVPGVPQAETLATRIGSRAPVSPVLAQSSA